MTDFRSIREKIMEAVQTSFESMQEGLPVDLPYAFAFDLVQRQELDASSARGKRYCVAILDTTETKTPDTYPIMRSVVRVFFEFLILVERHENPTTKLNLVYSEAERKLKEDQTFGGLAIMTEVTGTDSNIAWAFDRYIEGTLTANIHFRHSNIDPRERV